MKLSLASKIAAMFSLGLAVISFLLISLFSSEVSRRYSDPLIERGKHTVDELVINTDRLLALGLSPDELMGYDTMLMETIEKTEGILYLAFLDSEGKDYFQAGVLPNELALLHGLEGKLFSAVEENEFIIHSHIATHFPHGGGVIALLDNELIEQKTMEFVGTTLIYAVFLSIAAIVTMILYLRVNLGDPLKRLVSRIQGVDLNEVHQMKGPLSLRHDEIGLVARTFDGMLRRLSLNQTYLAKTNEELVLLTRDLEDRVEKRTQELEKINKQLQSLAHIDMLTGLLNRHCLEEVLQPRFENARYNNHLFAILVMDLDRFKAINDTHGHAAGDRALAVIGERIRSGLRYGDRVFRYGGDEFVFIFEDYANNAALITIIEKIHKVILQPVIFEGQVLDFGLSIGAASTAYCTAGTVQDLMKKADQAMYEAKRDNVGYAVSQAKLPDKSSE